MSKKISPDLEPEYQYGQIVNKKKDAKVSEEKWYKRQDVLLWISGLIFCAIIIALMMGIGYARKWDAWSGITHNQTRTSRERFLPEPEYQQPHIRGRSGPDLQARWYYWKLKPQNVTPYTRLFAWFCYLSHQMLIWGILYRAQLLKAAEASGQPKYTTRINTFNWVALGINAFFHVLHLINTHTTYDALAQDVSIVSSQGSVILILNFILLMEYRDRGLFFGWPTMDHKTRWMQVLRLNYAPVYLVRKYHGYAFAWGAIYTFWYHPMENTIGHALGFIYTWLLMLQGSTMYTKFHNNVYWKLFLEIYVIIHGGLVAWQTGGDLKTNTKLWPMFVFGFGLVFALTQIFSLPFWKKIPWWTRIIPVLPVIGVIIWAFSWIKDDQGRAWVRLPEVLRIPASYYIFTLVSWLLVYIFLAIERCCRGDKANDPAKTVTGRVLWLLGGMTIFGIGIGVAIAIELGDIKIPFLIQMFLFQVIFVVCATTSLMLIKQSVPNKKITKESLNTKITDPDDEQILYIKPESTLPLSDGLVNRGFISDQIKEECSTPL